MDEYTKQIVAGHVIGILDKIGENSHRDGLVNTPLRVARAYEEIFRGYDPEQRPEITKFKSTSDKMVLKKNIPIYSMCEHHMIPYFGICHVAYIPDGKVIMGMSKITRLVQYLASKLTIQEHLTAEIADEMIQEMNPQGVAITTRCLHLCEGMRGARVQGSEFEITELRGLFLSDERAHNEFMYKTMK